jgi:hypothetical protein
VEKYRDGRACPDAVLVPEEHFAGHGEWADPSGVLLVLEVTSYDSDSDTDRRDRQEKPVAYGAGIPNCRTAPFGVALLIPEPLGIELDTEKLKQYVG